MGNIKSVLFVCTGNSCRSVMAEGFMKKYLRELGKADIEVRSAGISAAEGFFPTAETIEVMR
ncbi:MAG: low molecular weight protein arginine phosphatase, partial [Candidatus Omnitrophota bacterium]